MISAGSVFVYSELFGIFTPGKHEAIAELRAGSSEAGAGENRWRAEGVVTIFLEHLARAIGQMRHAPFEVLLIVPGFTAHVIGALKDFVDRLAVESRTPSCPRDCR